MIIHLPVIEAKCSEELVHPDEHMLTKQNFHRQKKINLFNFTRLYR